MKLKILLATPEDRTTLGTIGGYIKKTLEDMGNEVSVFDFRAHPYSRGKLISSLKTSARRVFPRLPSPYDLPIVRPAVDMQINEELMARACDYRPDLLLVLLGENITPTTLSVIRKMGARTANWIFDSMLLSQSERIVRDTHPYYDSIFIVDSTDVLRYIGIDAPNVTTLPLAYEPGVHRRVELSDREIEEYGSDVAFVGSVTPERERLLVRLSDFDLKIWGRWPRELPALKKSYGKKDVYAGEAVKIYNAAKIIIDIHNLYCREGLIFNVTPRVFEVPASGGFILPNHVPQIESFYEFGKEIVTYKDIDDMRSLIRYYLQHEEERKAIAARAYERVHRGDRYLDRLETLLRVVFGK